MLTPAAGRPVADGRSWPDCCDVGASPCCCTDANIKHAVMCEMANIEWVAHRPGGRVVLARRSSSTCSWRRLRRSMNNLPRGLIGVSGGEFPMTAIRDLASGPETRVRIYGARNDIPVLSMESSKEHRTKDAVHRHIARYTAHRASAHQGDLPEASGCHRLWGWLEWTALTRSGHASGLMLRESKPGKAAEVGAASGEWCGSHRACGFARAYLQ